MVIVLLLVAACKGGSVTGAAGSQVNQMGGPGMERSGGSMDRNSSY